jgi:hypothetical protein
MARKFRPAIVLGRAGGSVQRARWLGIRTERRGWRGRAVEGIRDAAAEAKGGHICGIDSGRAPEHEGEGRCPHNAQHRHGTVDWAWHWWRWRRGGAGFPRHSGTAPSLRAGHRAGAVLSVIRVIRARTRYLSYNDTAPSKITAARAMAVHGRAYACVRGACISMQAANHRYRIRGPFPN